MNQKEFIKSRIQCYSNPVSSKLPESLDSTLQDVAQMYDDRFDYSDIMEFGNKWKSLDKKSRHDIVKLATEVVSYQEDGDDDEAENSANKLVDFLIEKNYISKK